MLAFFKKTLSFYRYVKREQGSFASGCLAYFLFVGAVPFLFVLNMLMKQIGLDDLIFQRLTSGLFGAFAGEVNRAVQAKGTTLFMVEVSLYSSTHFYYHLLVVGENLYGDSVGYISASLSGKKRLRSFVRVLLLQLALLSVAVVLTAVNAIFSLLKLSDGATEPLIVLAQVLTVLMLSLLLHAFSFPCRIRIIRGVRFYIRGALLTFFLWLIISVGFSVYLSVFPRMGGLAVAIAFALYLYLLMKALTVGMCYNKSRLGREYKGVNVNDTPANN